MNSNATKIQYLNSLRALATLGVIVIHVSSPLVNMTYGKNMPFWWIGNIIDSSVRYAVPIFLMLSGATLLGKKISLAEFYKKRFSRVLIPFVFWLILYWIYRWAMLLPTQQPIDIHSTFNWAINLFLTEGVSKHFWYIYMILFLYLILPFIGMVLHKMNKSTVLYLLLGWIILTVVFKSTAFNLYGWSQDYVSKFSGYLLHSGYLVLGYYLSKYIHISTKTSLLASATFVSSILFSAIFTSLLSKSGNKLDLSIYSYLSINTIIQSISVFLLVKDISIKNKLVLWVQNKISDYSYGIYLAHIMVIGILFRNGIYWNVAHPLVSIPVLTIVVLVCSSGMVYVLRKLPLGKYISG